MELIEKLNEFTRREFNEDEVYIFSVILCDNETDRDNEKFSLSALSQMKSLFIGKTGIFDHNAKTSNQTARIFNTEIVSDETKITKSGEVYTCLKATAYMVRTKSNEDLIKEIEGGIKKEVSVSCRAEKRICSVCSSDTLSSSCSHRGGKKYGDKECYFTLSEISDAYEWSFVAVPAQKLAGVTKSASTKGKENDMNKILSMIESKKSFTLSDSDCSKLSEYIDSLQQSAKDGVFYRDSLTGEVVRLSAVVQPDISRETMESIAKTMTVAQLKEFKTAFEKKKNESVVPVPQLYNEKNKSNAVSNGQFKI